MIKGEIMELSFSLIGKHLARCRVQQKQASTKEEAERLLAEEEGLLDAMLGRDRTEIYGQNQRSSIATSYEIGLRDGQALMGLQRWSDRRQSISNLGGGWQFPFWKINELCREDLNSSPPLR